MSKSVRKKHVDDSLAGKLWSHLIKHHPFPDKDHKIEKSYVLKKILRIEYDSSAKKRLGNLSSTLYDDILKHYFRERYEQDEVYRNELELSVLRRFKLDELYYQKSNAVRNKLLKNPDSARKYQQLTNLESNLYYYSAMEKMIDRVPGLHAYNANLENYYRIAKLRFQCEIENRNNIIQSNTTGNDENNDPAGTSSAGHLLEEMYLGVLELNRSYDSEQYDALKERFLQEWKVFSEDDSLIFLSYLINFSTKRFKKGSNEDLREAFELYKFGVESALLIESNIITPDNFRNAVFSACGVKEFDWAEGFTTNYGRFLPASIQEGIINLAKARIAFGRKDFMSATELTVQDAQVGFTNKLLAKFILTKAYYELGTTKIAQLHSHVKSFESFLNRDGLHHENTKVACKNFLRIVKLLIREKNKPTKEQIDSKLAAYSLIVGKEWLKEKIAALPE
ncbi:hypothetical protein CEQ90_05205 [Lewinellaceae bacterium SD302]|nr:hypothetical protein CEQ90_05205 [Lewinellaceae bacterium SD302]